MMIIVFESFLTKNRSCISIIEVFYFILVFTLFSCLSKINSLKPEYDNLQVTEHSIIWRSPPHSQCELSLGLLHDASILFVMGFLGFEWIYCCFSLHIYFVCHGVFGIWMNLLLFFLAFPCKKLKCNSGLVCVLWWKSCWVFLFHFFKLCQPCDGDALSIMAAIDRVLYVNYIR